MFTRRFASNYRAALFVPSFFMVAQRFEEWRVARKRGLAPAQQHPILPI